MKILHLITRLILGGAQENTVLTCEGQSRAGHEVILAYGPIYGPEGSLHERASQGGYDLVELSAMIRAVRLWTDWRCYRQCRELIQRVKPDVVHTHSSKAGIIGRAAAAAENVPAIVHTIHGLAFHPHQSRLIHAAYVAAEKWAARRCDRIACVADAMSRQALAAGVGQAELYETVYSGMEIGPFVEAPAHREATRQALGFEKEDVVIGTVARLAELKGHDDLLDAMGDTLRQRPRVKLLWVGDGWWRDRLEQKVRQMRLTEQVVITGLVAPARVPAMMSAMDLMVHPSYREGLARALPQALLSGLPIVSYDCDGAGEVCVDGETGRLAPTGDIEALRQATTWMIDHPAEAAAMAQAGREICRRRFDAAVMVEQLLDLYQRILQQKAHA
ncbi:glycosyltransferase family 4 protein [Planctomycetales bacterium ZRK34]|nr:glycosyltransferase family 4 protein [Planctomycetales bacterium ZRK34]